jgi:hypothetical protein
MAGFRPYRDSDYPALQELLKAQSEALGEVHTLPDINSVAMVMRLVIEGDDGAPRMFLFGRQTVEAYIVVDPKAQTRARRGKDFKAMTEFAEAGARCLGVRDCYALVTPAIGGETPEGKERWFSKQLRKTGWDKLRSVVFRKEL